MANTKDQAEALIRLIGEDGISKLADSTNAKLKELVGHEKESTAEVAKQETAVQKLKNSWTMMAVGVNQGLELVGKFSAGVGAVAAAVRQAAQEQAVAGQFDRAFGSGADNLERLRTASQGLLADNVLRDLATQGSRAGITLEQMGRLFGSATRAAVGSGKDVAETAAAFLKSTIEGNDEATKQLGILVNLGGAQDEYARGLGRTAASLTAAQRAQASLGEITRQTDQAFKSATGDETLARLSRVEAKWENLKAAVREVALSATIGLPESLAAVEEWNQKVVKANADAFADAVAKGDYSQKNIDAIVAKMRQAGNVQEAMTVQTKLSARATELYADEQRRLDAAFAERAAALARLAQAEKARVTGLQDEVREEDNARHAAVEHARQLALMASAIGSTEQASDRWREALRALGNAHVSAADDVTTLYAAVKNSNSEIAKAIELEAEWASAAGAVEADLAAAAGDTSGAAALRARSTAAADALRAQAVGVVLGETGSESKRGSGGGGSRAPKRLANGNLPETQKSVSDAYARAWELHDAQAAIAASAEDRRREASLESIRAYGEQLQAQNASIEAQRAALLAGQTRGFESAAAAADSFGTSLRGLSGIDLGPLGASVQAVDPLVAKMREMAAATDLSHGAMVDGAAGIVAGAGKITAGLIKNETARAAVMALVETAEGIGAVAIGDYVGGGLHFASAAMYGVVAGMSAGGGGKGQGGRGSAKARPAEVARMPRSEADRARETSSAPIVVHITGGTFIGTDRDQVGRDLAAHMDRYQRRGFRGPGSALPE